MLTKNGLVKAISDYIDKTHNKSMSDWYSGLYIFNITQNRKGDELIILRLIFKDLQHAKDITFCDETDFKQLKKCVDKLFETQKKCNICTDNMPNKYTMCKECNNCYCLKCVINIYKHSDKPVCPYCRYKI
jgi:hypothetical protein